MTGSKHNQLLALLSSTVALSVIAGCATPVTQKAPVESTVNKGATTATTPAAAVDSKKAGLGDPSGADPNTALDNSNDGAIDKAKPMQIKASEGGVYVSDDGLLKAIFPPGSLSRDTTIRMVRVDTSKMKNSDVFLNGIRYQMDLGNAIITPGSRISISSKADDRLIGQLKSMYTDYTPERYSLSKDEKGNWNVTMSMHGPVANDPKGFKGGEPEPTRGVMQEGGFPITAKGGGFHQDSRIEAFCNYAPPPLPASYGNFEAHVTWISDAESGLAGLPAQEPYSGNPAQDSRVWVDFGTTFSAAPLPPAYTITAPAVPPTPLIEVDQYGNVWGTPPAAMATAIQTALNAKAHANQFVDPCSNPINFTGANWTQPGAPSGCLDTAASPAATVASAPRQHNTLLAATAGSAEVVATSTVAATLGTGMYAIGGHPFSGSCNCGPFIVAQDAPVIQGASRRLTDAAGVARIQALQSYNSQNCSAGVCAGGPTNFVIFAQAKYDWPRLAPNSDRFVGGLGNVVSGDSAAGPVDLTIDKWSPFIKLNLTDSTGITYTGPLKMEYKINGVAQTPMVFSDLTSVNADHLESFFMPNIKTGAPGITDPDVPQILTIDKIYSMDSATLYRAKPQDLAQYQAYPIQRGNVFSLNVDIVNNDAK